MAERKIKISWEELEEILQKREVILKEERIREMTLVHPKGIILYIGRKK